MCLRRKKRNAGSSKGMSITLPQKTNGRSITASDTNPDTMSARACVKGAGMFSGHGCLGSAIAAGDATEPYRSDGDEREVSEKRR